ncbi:MAG: hypothetical protein EBE86_001340 [Hormoscilla sp. GUM202]|nr:hypothetical protein [Hormoscilla sp. GUM202]
MGSDSQLDPNHLFTHRLTSSQASFAVVVARPDRRRTTWIAYPPGNICCSEALRRSFLSDRRIASIIWMRSTDTIEDATNLNQMGAKLLELKRLGTQTTIGQFGLAHTALNYLGELALDNLQRNSANIEYVFKMGSLGICISWLLVRSLST